MRLMGSEGKRRPARAAAADAGHAPAAACRFVQESPARKQPTAAAMRCGRRQTGNSACKARARPALRRASSLPMDQAGRLSTAGLIKGTPAARLAQTPLQA